MTPWNATLRLQLHAGFTLDDAAAQVPYYAALGISHYYLSPIARAVAGSTHGYDVADPTEVNPELGGEPAMARLADTLHAHGMGTLLDIVPNHMAAHLSNPWWRDVLLHGRHSRHAAWFDIDWRAPGADGRVCLPVLDRPYAAALTDGQLQLASDPVHDVPSVQHYDAFHPLDPATLPAAASSDAARWMDEVNADARRGGTVLHALLEAQAYRLAWWQSGNDSVNYRRFFDVASLVALRVERPDVFDAVHALPLRLIEAGYIDGLRIDHIDGLAEPRTYLRRLRRRMDHAARGRGTARASLPLYVEKILAPGETLRGNWRCDGTTGYDFMDECGAVLHDPRGEPALAELWRASGRSGDFAAEEHTARREILANGLHADHARAVRALAAVGESLPVPPDLSAHQLGQAITAGLAEFPVYRTYAIRDGLDADDTGILDTAWASAAASAAPGVREALLRTRAWLVGHDGLRTGAAAPRPDEALLHAARTRVEQLSAPLNAKAVEDTVFYRHGLLLSRNEVGAGHGRFALSAPGFHAACAERARHWPRALLATATHDHKRGEDTRARLAVLSERADWWRRTAFEALDTARGLAGDREDSPSPGDQLMLFQTLVAAWPVAWPEAGKARAAPDGMDAFAARVVAWQLKAIREAKLRTAWTAPDDAYEAACRGFTEAILLGDDPALRDLLGAAAHAIGPAGAMNGLAQLALKLTVPGVPDIYQGTDGWDQSLVDPDNRRPVDLALRQGWSASGAPLAERLADWRSGSLKQWLLARLLHARRARPALFAQGTHVALAGSGAAAQHVLAFTRRHGAQSAIVAVPRFAAALLGERGYPLAPAAAWGDALLDVPPGEYDNALTGERLVVGAGRLRLDCLFAAAPVALLLAVAPQR